MKKHITIEQLNELSEKAKEKLVKWWTPSEGDLCTNGPLKHNFNDIPMIVGNDMWSIEETKEMALDGESLPRLSIGQMIEYLDEIEGDKYIDVHYGLDSTWRYIGPITLWDEDTKDNLCDALWQAVKEDLEKI